MGNKRDCYLNRELSWLKFNERVLEEAEDSSVPLMERLSFVSIFQSNLDEFFMVRVGSLYDQMLLSEDIRDNKTGMSCREQLDAIMEKVSQLMHRKDEAYIKIMKELERYEIRLVHFAQLQEAEQEYIYTKFINDIKPLLFPTILGKKQPIPFLKNSEIYGVAELEKKNGKRKIAIVPCASPLCSRTIEIPSRPGTFMLIEEIILHFFQEIFPAYKVAEKSLIRIIRNADIEEAGVYDEDLDYRKYMSEVVKVRKKLAPVRMDMSRELNDSIIRELCGHLQLEKENVFLALAPLEYGFCDSIRDELRDKKELFYEKRKPQSSELLEKGAVIPQILKKDILLSYPYESIHPFISMLQEAAEDENVLSIHMTLYRLAKNSLIVEALVNAAENGKVVGVLVELNARFDEENNINWSRKLEEAGCNVTYGLEGLKVHSKLCLITRKIENEIQYITQIGTGNYNEVTARLYTDLSIMTANQEIGAQTAEIFRCILMGETVKEAKDLLIAPNCLQNRILSMIEEEIEQANGGKAGYIGIKVNSLTDKKIIDKLIQASQSGVKIEMIIRGICCLNPGIPGFTQNVQIKSIVGRLLEHSRIYIFGEGERRKIYLASADLMTRNTTRRVEVGAPILDEELSQRIEEMFITMWSDNVKARIMTETGDYKREEIVDTAFNSQEFFYDMAYKNAREL
jgi:polyphosphate kinase